MFAAATAAVTATPHLGILGIVVIFAIVVTFAEQPPKGANQIVARMVLAFVLTAGAVFAAAGGGEDKPITTSMLLWGLAFVVIPTVAVGATAYGRYARQLSKSRNESSYIV